MRWAFNHFTESLIHYGPDGLFLWDNYLYEKYNTVQVSAQTQMHTIFFFSVDETIIVHDQWEIRYRTDSFTCYPKHGGIAAIIPNLNWYWEFLNKKNQYLYLIWLENRTQNLKIAIDIWNNNTVNLFRLCLFQSYFLQIVFMSPKGI